MYPSRKVPVNRVSLCVVPGTIWTSTKKCTNSPQRVQIIVNAGLDVLFGVIVDDKGFLTIVMITLLVFPVPGKGYFVVEFL